MSSLLLMLVFLTNTSSEIISKFLKKYGNPIRPQMQETAAALNLSEGTMHKKRYLKEGILADMTVEEQIEISDEGDADNAVKTKESIKVQYHWYNKEEDDSKGKYIGSWNGC